MWSNLKLSIVKEKTTPDKKAPTKEMLNETAKAKIEKILFFMLNHVTVSELKSDTIYDLLLKSNFIEEQEDGHSLTVDGFRFLLEDIYTQIHTLLLNYIKFRK
jgi:transcription initiation factor TFIIH subunit 4